MTIFFRRHMHLPLNKGIKCKYTSLCIIKEFNRSFLVFLIISYITQSILKLHYDE